MELKPKPTLEEITLAKKSGWTAKETPISRLTDKEFENLCGYKMSKELTRLIEINLDQRIKHPR